MTSEGAPCGELTVVARIPSASNQTFLASVDDVPVVYKPSAGERPLWDFPDGDLAMREVAAYLVSERLGWNLVPRTWLRDGPYGPGMVQLWQHVDPGRYAVDLVAADAVPERGWRRALEGADEDGRRVALIHEDAAALRRMAVFDAIVNNADRKGGHVLPVPGGHRYGVDHGLTFHAEHKLRTVLWGWAGEPLTRDEAAGVQRVLAALDGALGDDLAELLDDEELEALAGRCEQLLARPVFPSPRDDSPTVPWPLF